VEVGNSLLLPPRPRFRGERVGVRGKTRSRLRRPFAVPGAARRPVTFSCSPKRKQPKRTAPHRSAPRSAGSLVLFASCGGSFTALPSLRSPASLESPGHTIRGVPARRDGHSLDGSLLPSPRPCADRDRAFLRSPLPAPLKSPGLTFRGEPVRRGGNLPDFRLFPPHPYRAPSRYSLVSSGARRG
jgi:hypothetical protein